MIITFSIYIAIAFVARFVVVPLLMGWMGARRDDEMFWLMAGMWPISVVFFIGVGIMELVIWFFKRLSSFIRGFFPKSIEDFDITDWSYIVGWNIRDIFGRNRNG